MAPILTARVRRIRPLYTQPDGALWVSRGFQVFTTRDQARTLTPVAAYNPGATRRLRAGFRLTERLFREGFHHLTPLSDGTVVGVVKGGIVKRRPGEPRFRHVFSFPRGSRPLSICHTPDDRIYFGEYFGNPEREAVHIYGSSDLGESWQVVHTFPKGSIRHVHGVFYDPYRTGCWVLTGDHDHESMMLFTDDDFRNLEPVVGGSQKARVVTVLPMKDGLIAPTDTPLEQNYIQWLDPKEGKLRDVAPVGGSVFYGCQAGSHQLISTVVEPSEVNPDRKVCIHMSKGGEDWSVLHHRQKDALSMRYFQYGTFTLPQGENPSPICYAYGQAVSRDDGHLLAWDLEAGT